MKDSRSLRSNKRSMTISSYLFLLPFMAFFILFTVIPVIATMLLSFTDFNMVTPPVFSGFSNFTRFLLDDDIMLIAVRNTLIFAVMTGPFSYFLCLILAWLINELTNGLRVLFTAVFYIPSISMAAVAIFLFIFSGDTYGLANSLLIKLGLIRDPVYWLTDPNYNMKVIIVIQLWLSLGVGFLSFIAGLQSIDRTLYEAGAIDGIRNRFQEFYYITLASMRPQLMFGAVMQISASFGVAQVPMTLTGFPSTNNSTTTIVSHMMDVSSIRMDMGYACTIATILFVVLIITRNLISLVIKSD